MEGFKDPRSLGEQFFLCCLMLVVSLVLIPLNLWLGPYFHKQWYVDLGTWTFSFMAVLGLIGSIVTGVRYLMYRFRKTTDSA